MMKKLLTIVLILIFLSGMILPVTASASDGLTFSVGTVTAQRGQTGVVVPVSVTGNSATLGFTALGLVANYNANHLTLTRVDSVETRMPLNRDYQLTTTQGSQWIPLINANTPFTSDGPLVNLIFDVKADAPLTESGISLTFTPPPRFGAPASTSSAAVNGVLSGNFAAGGVNITASSGGGGTPPGGGTPQGPSGDRPTGQFGVTIVSRGTGATGNGWYAPGATVSLNAGTAPAGETFVNWTASPSVTFTPNANGAAATFPMPSNDVTVTANWSGGGGGGGGSGDNPGGGTGGGGTGGGAGGGGTGGGAGSGTAHRVISHFGTWTGSGTSSARVDAEHGKFVRLTKAGAVVAATNYTVTAGSTIITLNEEYIKTLAAGTHTFRAEFSDGHADLNMIISTSFGNVPQTGLMDITGMMVVMWVSILLTVSLCAYLLWYIKLRGKRIDNWYKSRR